MQLQLALAAMNAPLPPCRNVAIVTPAGVPASPPSSKMAARDRAQSWRGKYLRALNICPEDIELARRHAERATDCSSKNDGKSRLRSMSFHRSDHLDPYSRSKSYSSSTEKEEEERKSLERATQHDPFRSNHGHQQHHIQAVPLRAPATRAAPLRPGAPTNPVMVAPSASNPYGFTMRPNLARGRRFHSEPFDLPDRASAPIQIPTASGVCNQLDGNERQRSPVSQCRRASPLNAEMPINHNKSNHHHSANVRLLSWEEPAAMLAAGDALSRGWKLPHDMAMGLNVGRPTSDFRGVEQQQHDNFVDTMGDDDDDESHGGDIFEMEGLDDTEEPDDEEDNQPHRRGKSRRRYRTESMNIVTSGREKRSHVGFHDVDGHDSDQSQDLSQSFVPPHQMVQRDDCFSLGMRDEFKKRRPANNI